jgi:hypothetical protein
MIRVKDPKISIPFYTEVKEPVAMAVILSFIVVFLTVTDRFWAWTSSPVRAPSFEALLAAMDVMNLTRPFFWHRRTVSVERGKHGRLYALLSSVQSSRGDCDGGGEEALAFRPRR